MKSLSDVDLLNPLANQHGFSSGHRKPRKMKKDSNFWSEHALSMELGLPHQQHHLGDHPFEEKKKRRRKKEDKGEKTDKSGTGKKRGRKPKSSKLGSAGIQDPGGTPMGEYMGHDWPGAGLPVANNPGVMERFGEPLKPNEVIFL